MIPFQDVSPNIELSDNANSNAIREVNLGALSLNPKVAILIRNKIYVPIGLLI